MLVWLPDQCPVYPRGNNINYKHGAWDNEIMRHAHSNTAYGDHAY